MHFGIFSRATAAVLIAGISIGIGASQASADQIVMRDGTVYEGTIVSNTRREIIIDTEINGIRTRLTLDRRQIQSVTEGEVAAETADEQPPAVRPPALTPNQPVAKAAEKKTQLKRDGVDLIVEIPMSGTFGQDIYPLSIAEGLQWAYEQGATDIVFRMNSPGGEVWAAEEIVEVMAEYSGRFRYHALIEHAISATIWPAFNCDTITMAPGATFGGAVVFRMTGTGTTEVDLKMTSIMAAKLGASAEAKGHSPYLVNAMMMSESEVYAVKQGDEWVLVGTKPESGSYEVIVDSKGVLTLTSEQAGRFGIATVVRNRDIDTFAAAQGFGEFDHHSETTYDIARRTNDQCKRLRGQIIGTIMSFYREADISGGRSSTAGYASSIQNMRRQLGQYKVLMNRAENLKMAAITDALERAIDVPYWEREIETRMAELQRQRRLRGRP